MTRRTMSLPNPIDAELLTKMQARGLRSPSEYVAFLVTHDRPPGAHHAPSGLTELHARVMTLERQQQHMLRVLDVLQHQHSFSASRSLEEAHTLTRFLLTSLRVARQEGVEILDPLQEP